ncbi:MAG: hypothetical protein ACTSRE_07855 [Promethearchaeota archaeon]
MRISANPSVGYDKNIGIAILAKKYRQNLFYSISGMWYQNETQSLW